MKLSPAVTVGVSSKVVEPPVETSKPPCETLAEAMIPSSLHGKGPAFWLAVPYVALSEALVPTASDCAFAATPKSNNPQNAATLRRTELIVHPRATPRQNVFTA